MARPKKDEAEKRTERFNLRYTLAERIQIDASAAKLGLDPTEYQRRCSLNYPMPSASTRVDPALISELNRIGVNLNQLTKAVNSGRRTDVLHPQEIYAELSRVLEQVASSYGH